MVKKDEQYDVVVIGGGPGGYVSAIRCAQLGFKTACVESRGSLGGTCLNVGCIPSKALLESSHLYHEAQINFKEHGINITGLKFNLKAMMERKDKIVKDLTDGIAFLFKKNKVEYIAGHGMIAGPNAVKIDDKALIHAKHIIIATGSRVAQLPGVEIDEKQIVSSTGALELKEVPKHLVLIGGGVIGLEMGSVYRRLGAKVTVIEFMDEIVPGMDTEISRSFRQILQKQGMEFMLSTKVTGAKKKAKEVELTVEPSKGAKGDVKPEKIKGDVVLVATGRVPNTEGLGCERQGIKLDDRGRIEVDAHFETSMKGVYAIGDVIKGAMLAHKAEEEGVVLAEMLAGQKPHIDYNCIPGVVYTDPEIASVGLTEEQVKESGVKYNIGKFPFKANSRGRAVGRTEGMVKIIADAKTDTVLGAHIIGPDAGTLIAELVLAMEYGASSEDIARTCHAHPTLNEAVKEAALAVDKRAVHI